MILQAAIEITCHNHSTIARVGHCYIVLRYLVFVVRFLFVRWFPCIRHSIFWGFPHVMVRVPLQMQSRPCAVQSKLSCFEAGWFTCGCICTVHKEEWKGFSDFVDTEYQKLISRKWLSFYRSLSRMLQLHPASNSYCMSIDKPTVVLKRFFGNSLGEFCSH